MLKEIFAISQKVKARTQYEVLASLTEEVGELATEVKIKEGSSYKDPGVDGIIGECIDVIICAVDMIYMENPNISEAEFRKHVDVKLLKWLSKKEKDPIKVGDALYRIYPSGRKALGIACHLPSKTTPVNITDRTLEWDGFYSLESIDTDGGLYKHSSYGAGFKLYSYEKV